MPVLAEPRIRDTYAVWELTLQCNLGCLHCGSRAARSRNNELSTAEALDLVLQLADAGITEVTLIGGEAYLRPDWLTIVKAIRDSGMRCTLTTGGYGISATTAKQMADAGLQQVSVSIDGCQDTHDYLRGRTGSWKACGRTLEHVRDAGISISCNTQINRLSAPELPLVYQHIVDIGCRAWQLALTVPMGRAAERPEILLQPPELLDLFPLLGELAARAKKDDVLFCAGNNIGYYGPYERALRSSLGHEVIWEGCQAGLTSLGIEADGTVKGCPSLPTKAYAGGSVRSRSLQDLVLNAPELQMNTVPADYLWGFCRSCEYAPLCRGGCSWTAHVFFGQRGNNPYCHHRALENQRRGIRELLVRIQPPPGEPFDHGLFQMIEEPFETPWPSEDRNRFTKERIRWTPAPGPKHLPPVLAG